MEKADLCAFMCDGVAAAISGGAAQATASRDGGWRLPSQAPAAGFSRRQLLTLTLAGAAQLPALPALAAKKDLTLS